jgi:hypothetical protein
MTAPMTTPPAIRPGLARNARLAKTNAATAAATASASPDRIEPAPVSAPSTLPRSECAAPKLDVSKRNTSSVLTRQIANNPLSVMYAEMPSTMSTTSDLRLPAPRRISVLLPQPEASCRSRKEAADEVRHPACSGA